MFKFILKRILMVIPTFIAITFVTFALIHFIPGDPVEIMMGERGLTPEVHQQMMKQLGLDLPLYQQYFNYISYRDGYVINGLFHANFLVGINFDLICFTLVRFTTRGTFRR